MILKSFTIRVTRYNTTAEDTHLKSPKVTRFKGSKSMLITGLATKDVMDMKNPVNIRVFIPLPKTIPDAILVTSHKEYVSMTK
ncbi:MAG: hypothetical protein US60_C0034G0005 [Microgenomates group bacterium GW2011_GWC1_37_8]|uniref:Uncharacterized protein n=1 Tax=Candidatus Woesebacteria bacterium GW2011_GWB1_38_8 TaxID=1618570 RepID=A0A0G0LBQ7_9BACT|nr:MAG: hypothetical protein US60_C0034G0005 [Microgenomates group bacterium GW2011_GWC1_37_8]KKQ85295.1 MAG: hypothetical protein UT08_C0008G0051 [Candidatus Woesebacteria bacterium GW2011_GWB1_38_8]